VSTIKRARIERVDGWNALAGVARVEWVAHLEGGVRAMRDPRFRTRREAREWCDELGYDWHPQDEVNP
jgi:hypothetical protein